MSEKNGHSHTQHPHNNPVLDAIIQTSIAAEFIRQNVDQVCGKLGITGTQYNVLRILKRAHPRGCSRNEVLAQLIEKSVDVTRVIDGLERRGFVERLRTSEDRRLSLSMITASGITLLGELDIEFMALLNDITHKLGEEQWKELATICRTLSQR